MLFKYEATTPEGEVKKGGIEAVSREVAIDSLQRRGLILTAIQEEKVNFFVKLLASFQRIKTRDIVILSRQLATLFEAKVPILTALQLLASEAENPALRQRLTELLDDIQGGSSISDAMRRQPDVFSGFFVSMVRSGEESGKLDEVFNYLASYLERSYELSSKAKSALVYPVFILVAFIAVMVLMLTYVVPKISDLLKESGQELPFYTKIIISVSDFLVNYGLFFLIGLILAGIGGWFWLRTPQGKAVFSRFQISIPYIGNLYKKLYLSRIMDNFETLLSSGISAVRTLELTSEVIDNEVYKRILLDSLESVKAGTSLSESFSHYEDMPGLIVQMVRVGEETGKLAFVLKTLSHFYKREVDTAIGTLMSLIEPALIIVLGGGVGLIVIGILGPIYSMTGNF